MKSAPLALLILLFTTCVPATQPAAQISASGAAATNQVAGDDTATLGANLDQRLSDAYQSRDWTKLQPLLAPEYSAISEDFEWDIPTLQREFPKIHLLDFKIERQRTKRLAPDLLLVNEIIFMHETYEKDDISGRYSSADIWVRRNGRWLLLIEQEVRLRDTPK